MKHSLPLFWALILCSLFIFMSCSKNSADTPKTTTTSNPTGVLVSGNFVISSFTQKVEDKTSLFKGVVFTFSNAGVVSANSNGATTTGKWTYTPSAVGYYGSTGSKSSFTLDLGTAAPFNRISKVWNIDSTKSDASRLSLVNPEPLENEQLEFSKQ